MDRSVLQIMSDVIIIGGGAAGMMAAVTAAEAGHRVYVYEKNEKLGKKLYITGKGRCNLTNACEDVETMIRAVCSNPRFLYSAFYGFDNQRVMAFFQESGVALKEEHGARIFPQSDHASDIIRALEKRMRRAGVLVHLNCEVRRLLVRDHRIRGVVLADHSEIHADAVIVATGGKAYPATGSTGDGYRFAEETGHSVTSLLPSLVGMNVRETYVASLQGLTLKNVKLQILDDEKCLFQEFGEMMFTHYGISGPLVLTASALTGRQLAEHPLKACIDLKPALSDQVLDQRLIREFDAARNKQFKNVIGSLYPASLRPVIISLSGIEPTRPVHEIRRKERENLLHLTKAFPMTLTGLRGFEEAVITKGGIAVKQINPSTMESRLVRNLYFIGEVLDVDALTGGFNLQIAWSTAWLAAQNLHREKEHENDNQYCN